jgi:hypothetical protein
LHDTVPLKTLWTCQEKIRTARLDLFFLALFPVLFFIFNFFYWILFLTRYSIFGMAIFRAKFELLPRAVRFDVAIAIYNKIKNCVFCHNWGKIFLFLQRKSKKKIFHLMYFCECCEKFFCLQRRFTKRNDIFQRISQVHKESLSCNVSWQFIFSEHFCESLFQWSSSL